MQVMVEAALAAKGLHLNHEIQSFLASLGVEYKFNAMDLPNGAHYVSYSVFMEYPSLVLEQVRSYIQSSLGLRFGLRYFFRFTDEEYEAAPFFRIWAFGNTDKASTGSDPSAYRIDLLCPSCETKEREQIAPLVINTTPLKKIPAAWVHAQYIVVAQRVVDRFQRWDVTGYELVPVIHKGRGAGAPACQVKPTSVLPPWSSQMRFLDPPHLQDRVCDRCGRKLRIAFPLHYDSEALENAQDINITSDLIGSWKWTARAVVISARLRRLILDSGLALDARYSEEIGERHWTFEPVIVV